MLDTVFKNPWVRALGLLLVVMLVLKVVTMVQPILTSLFFAFLVAYTLHPVVLLLERFKIPRPAAVAVLGGFAVAVIVITPVFAIPAIVHEAEDLVNASRASAPDLSGWMAEFEERLPLERIVETLGWADPLAEDVNVREVLASKISTYLEQNMSTLTVAAREALWRVLSSAASLGSSAVGVIFALGNLTVFAFVAVYLLLDFDKLVSGTGGLVPPHRRAPVFRVAKKIDDQLHAFFRGQLAVCLGLAIMYSAGLLLSQTPFAVLLGVFGGIASVVPYLGIILTIGPAIILSLIEHGLDWHVAAVVATFTIAQMIEGTVLTPKIVGDSVGLNPVWIILAIMVFSSIFGFAGLLMAVPIAAALRVLVIEGVEYYRSTVLYRGASIDTSSLS